MTKLSGPIIRTRRCSDEWIDVIVNDWKSIYRIHCGRDLLDAPAFAIWNIENRGFEEFKAAILFDALVECNRLTKSYFSLHSRLPIDPFSPIKILPQKRGAYRK